MPLYKPTLVGYPDEGVHENQNNTLHSHRLTRLTSRCTEAACALGSCIKHVCPFQLFFQLFFLNLNITKCECRSIILPPDFVTADRWQRKHSVICLHEKNFWREAAGINWHYSLFYWTGVKILRCLQIFALQVHRDKCHNLVDNRDSSVRLSPFVAAFLASRNF